MVSRTIFLYKISFTLHLYHRTIKINSYIRFYHRTIKINSYIRFYHRTIKINSYIRLYHSTINSSICLYTHEKTILNLAKLDQIWIAITLLPLIWNQTELNFSSIHTYTTPHRTALRYYTRNNIFDHSHIYHTTRPNKKTNVT